MFILFHIAVGLAGAFFLMKGAYVWQLSGSLLLVASPISPGLEMALPFLLLLPSRLPFQLCYQEKNFTMEEYRKTLTHKPTACRRTATRFFRESKILSFVSQQKDAAPILRVAQVPGTSH